MPLSTILAEYDRLGGLCPGEFIKKWWSASSAGWIYPSDDGFQLDISSHPISTSRWYRSHSLRNALCLDIVLSMQSLQRVNKNFPLACSSIVSARNMANSSPPLTLHTLNAPSLLRILTRLKQSQRTHTTITSTR